MVFNSFCLLPGFPGKYTGTQKILVTAYLLLLINSFVVFTLSVSHLYCINAVPIRWWMGMCIAGLTLSSATCFFYFLLFKHNKKLGDPRMLSMLFDFPRLWVSLIATYFYNTLTVRSMFIYIYTFNTPGYQELLDQGLSTAGKYGFTETKMVEFLEECQVAFQFQLVVALIEYILLPLKPKIQQWLSPQLPK